jgi:hypothetical protein
MTEACLSALRSTATAFLAIIPLVAAATAMAQSGPVSDLQKIKEGSSLFCVGDFRAVHGFLTGHRRVA